MEIEYREIGSVTPYDRNPRRNDQAVDAVAASIEEFGFKVPMVVDSEGTIVAGHTRYKAAKRLGMRVVPVIVADDLTPEQVRAFRLADNKVAELADWDWDLLADELEGIETIDMEAFGFDADFDIETGEPEAEDDGYEVDPPEEPESRLGDVYRLGDHVLVVGDSTDPETIERAMDAMGEGLDADLLLTDPPYNVALGQHMRPSEAKQLNRRQDGLVIDNDEWEDDEGFVEFLRGAFEAALSRVRQGGAFYVWYASNQSKNVFSAAERAEMQVRQVIVWNKSIFAMGRQDYQWKHELCIYGWKDGAAHYFTEDRTLSTVWDYPEDFDPEKAKKAELVKMVKQAMEALEPDVWDCDKPSRSALHPTMKPIPLMARAIANSTRKGQIVLDPFGGSGSTLMTCEQMGRRCAIVELDPHYADVIIDRWETYTGREAVRVNAG